jgi:DNA-binding transcriptional ArsR family regulator
LTALPIIQAMSNPIRFAILDLVRESEMAAGEIAERFETTRPAVSQHLRVLREAGLLTERRVGVRRLYIIRPEGLDPLRAYLEDFWDLRLRRLKVAAEAAQRKKRAR